MWVRIPGHVNPILTCTQIDTKKLYQHRYLPAGALSPVRFEPTTHKKLHMRLEPTDATHAVAFNHCVMHCHAHKWWHCEVKKQSENVMMRRPTEMMSPSFLFLSSFTSPIMSSLYAPSASMALDDSNSNRSMTDEQIALAKVHIAEMDCTSSI